MPGNKDKDKDDKVKNEKFGLIDRLKETLAVVIEAEQRGRSTEQAMVNVEAILDRSLPRLDTVTAALASVRVIEETIDRLAQKMEGIMATLQNFNDLLAGINTETDRLAAKVQELMDLVTASGLTGAEETAILGKLQDLKDRLTVIGANPSEPIPPEPTDQPVP